MERWATFDCYGTLIDWNGGIGRELERLFGAERSARLLHGYHEVEREVEHERPAAPLPRGAHHRPRAPRRAGKASTSPRPSRTRSPARSRRGSPSPRFPLPSRTHAPGAGSSRSSRTPTATSSTPRSRTSAFRSSSRSSRRRSARTSPARRTGGSSRSERASAPARTCTSGRASTTTSPPRPSSGSPPSGSTGSARSRSRSRTSSSIRSRGSPTLSTRSWLHDRLREGVRVSLLRAKCPTCKANTAVAVGSEYECHSCGRTFSAGLVRVPRAWGDGGEQMVESALLPLDYPEASIVEEDSLVAQTLAVASDLPVQPIVLGGCCCSHVGAVEGLAARHGRIGVIWLDAHGDLNTPETSPSGNEWGMPLRMILDGGAADPHDVALIGARNLDPPEVEFIAAAGIHDDRRARARPGRLRLRGPRLRRLRAERAGGLHAGAGRADGRSRSSVSSAGSAPPARSSASASPASRPIAGTSRSSSASPPRSGSRSGAQLRAAATGLS